MSEMDITFPTRFLGLPEKFSSPANAQFAIVPVPYDQTSSYVPGARFAPRAVIEASSQIELYDEEIESEPYTRGIQTLPAIEPVIGNFPEMLKKIEEPCLRLLKEGKIPIIMGGEHTVALGLISALKKRRPVNLKNFAVLQFDAHADLRSSYQGYQYSHACVARRINDMRIPIVQVGLRSMTRGEVEFARQNKLIDQITMWQINSDSTEAFITHLLGLLPDRIYLSIDVDVLDPSIMPATGTPEPGGMGWYQLLRILRTVILSREIMGCDVTELSPLPALVAPNVLVARLIYKLIAYITHARS